ncbi:protein MODIFIER OF SNC1 1 [Malania oleifera]|uniref:protein MODIFIER OF SNC1 1 n=1 Tax=Malania oleifera TaxID=397392 RepID=UPI0025ADB110|nr:protein MODIFIER OF SNC1 1 [Malania oleifera]
MTSSMLTGERRSGSGFVRRSGMTVLGKVAVPKPLNLPSQRSENHGLDPNVEIVPKGTLSWGSRTSSSSASNAWGSSTLSPSTDGGPGSPSRLSGRPSSGGSGTRPSTAGSDRAHESSANAWGPNSRPSSASGALTSNQASITSLRPRSAEPRPGSSQLSRFAEPSSENSVAWGGAGTAEKLGVTSSKNDGFSLISGDFPTLGSEKNNSGKSTESQDHGPHRRPGSSSGVVAPVKESTVTSSGDVSVNANVKGGVVNSWRRESSPYVEDGGAQPGVEKWQSDPQPFPNASIPPQHFDPWHGAPMAGSPGGVWFRGPPYGAPVPPGGFPMEPFPYYRPQVPAALANTQPTPPPVAGPRGHHPKNGDLYRPHMPDAFIRPSVPIRPGFFHGPVTYEGYYAPPMGYCNPNERDIPFMGMAAGPSVYNRYSSQNAPDPSNSHAHFSGYGSTSKALASEQVESTHPRDTRGPNKVLLKQNNGWNGKDEEQKWEHAPATNDPHPEKGNHARASSWENDWGADYQNDEDMESRRILMGEESSSHSGKQGGCSSRPSKQNLSENMGDAKAVDRSLTKKLENASSASSDSTLIQKIEGLNAKARVSDGWHDVSSVSNREDHKKRLNSGNTNANISMNEASTDAAFERTHASGVAIPASHDVGADAGDLSLEATAAGTTVSRRGNYGLQAVVDNRGKAKFSPQETDGWRKKPLVADSSNVVSVTNFETSSNPHIQDRPASTESIERSGSYFQGKDDRDSVTPTFDPSDCHAQRAKMKELAKQKAKQLQKEEEERTREQKAKAHAKLEELNKRTQAVEGLDKKLDEVQLDGAIQLKQGESRNLVASTVDAVRSGVPTSESVSKSNSVLQMGESMSTAGESVILSQELPPGTTKNAHEEAVVTHNQSLPLQQDHNSTDTANAKTTLQGRDSSVSKQKRISYKQKQNTHLDKNLTEMSTTTNATEAPRSHTDTATNASASASAEVVNHEISLSSESSLPINPSVMAESTVYQRRKNNRGGKNKQKLEETSSMTASSLPVPKETTLAKTSMESSKPETPDSKLEASSVQSLVRSNDTMQSSEQRSSLPGEETHLRVNNQWKPQHSRRMPRNPQITNSGEKFHSNDAVVWAPVRSQNQREVAVEVNHRNVAETTTMSAKSDILVQNSPKSKRAEMERYVPKPVAKELAQQGSIQQTTAPFRQIRSDETIKVESGSRSIENTQPAGLVMGKVGHGLESRSGQGRQNKHAKAHGSWKQRVSTESTPVEGLQDGSSFTSNISKNVDIPIDHQTLKPDVHLPKEQPKYDDGWNMTDGWNITDNSESAAPGKVPAVKDLGATGRGKRHSFKGHKGSGNDFDQKSINAGDVDNTFTQSPALETSQVDRGAALKENRGAWERSTSHWQPKSLPNSTHNQRGSRSYGGQNATHQVGKAIKESTSQGGVHIPSRHEKETNENISQPDSHQTISEDSIGAEAPLVGHQDLRRERKVASLKGRPQSPKQGPVSPVEPVSASVDNRHEQRLSSGFRKNGNQSSRFGRGQESRVEWSSAGQDNRQHNPSANRDRHRHASHYEYQPVGPYNSSKSHSSEGPTDGSHITGSKFRERGHSHSRRSGGNFYGRHSGTVRVDSGYD